MIKLHFTDLMKNSVISLFVLFSLYSCSESEYSRLVKSEMDKGVYHDSLFLDMEFGITKKEFFDRCWKLNKQGIIKEGPRNEHVEYRLNNNEEKGKDIIMLYYGRFNDEKIMTGINLVFYYEAWSLWNKSLHSDQLMNIVSDSLKSWFPGNDFINVSLKSKGNISVKIDGNRRIMIEPLKDSREINARIDDLRYIID